jgi:hypothetical protein
MSIPIKQQDRWFNGVQSEFGEAVRHFTGRPITYVEVGTWAGAACEYVGRNVLTHPESRGFGIDPYPKDRKKHDVPEIKRHAAERMRFLGSRWQWIYEPSGQGLLSLRQRLGGRGVDLLYLDGLHEAYSVVVDFALAWPSLNQGATVVFDDYETTMSRGWPNVKEAVTAIHIAWRGLIRATGQHKRQHSVEVLQKDLGRLRDREKLMEAVAALEHGRPGHD